LDGRILIFVFRVFFRLRLLLAQPLRRRASAAAAPSGCIPHPSPPTFATIKLIPWSLAFRSRIEKYGSGSYI
jgi:hypothetical protein